MESSFCQFFSSKKTLETAHLPAAVPIRYPGPVLANLELPVSFRAAVYLDIFGMA